MESNGNELKEEYDKIDKMSSYERLIYLRNYAKFCKQMLESDTISLKELVERILLITKGYDQ